MDPFYVYRRPWSYAALRRYAARAMSLVPTPGGGGTYGPGGLYSEYGKYLPATDLGGGGSYGPYGLYRSDRGKY